jgi:hypothetical protein
VELALRPSSLPAAAAAPVAAPARTWQLLLLLFSRLPCNNEDFAAPLGVLSDLCTALLPLLLLLSLQLSLDMLL